GRKPRTLRSRTPTPRTPTPRTLTSRTRTSPSRLSDGRPIGGPGGAAGHGPAAEEYGAQPQRDGHDGTDEAVAGARTTTGGGQVQYRENRAGRSRRDGRQPTGARSVGAHAAAGARQDQPRDGQPEGARGQGQLGPGASVTHDAAPGRRHECSWNGHVAPPPLPALFSSSSLLLLFRGSLSWLLLHPCSSVLGCCLPEHALRRSCRSSGRRGHFPLPPWRHPGTATAAGGSPVPRTW